MKMVTQILEMTALPGAVVVLLTPDDRFEVDKECRAAVRDATPIDEANGAPIMAVQVERSCVVHADLTVRPIYWR